MPTQGESRLFGLIPGVRASAASRPWLGRKGVVGKHTEWRDDVLTKIFVLVIAPEHDGIRLKIIQNLACLAELRDQELAGPHGGRHALVVPVFLAHGCRPA